MKRLGCACGAVVALAAAAMVTGLSAPASAILARRAHAARATTPPACRTAHLQIVVGAGPQPGLDHQGLAIRFTNRGQLCSLRGYPGVDGFSARGQRLVSAQRTLSGYLGGVRRGRRAPIVKLAEGQTAAAVFEWFGGPARGTRCERIAYLELTAPGTTRSVRYPLSFYSADRRYQECDLQVHPVVPGRTGTVG